MLHIYNNREFMNDNNNLGRNIFVTIECYNVTFIF